jgi:hypothetical protein
MGVVVAGKYHLFLRYEAYTTDHPHILNRSNRPNALRASAVIYRDKRGASDGIGT